MIVVKVKTHFHLELQADLTKGQSTVTANFADGTVDAIMTGFTPMTAEESTGSNPIDTISAKGMNITGNSFAGGTVTLEKSGAVVTPLGNNTTVESQGSFFGYDKAKSIPDEVAGMTTVGSENGLIFGAFIAD